VSFISFYHWRITSYSTYDYFKGVSFETISAFADNAAVIHYRAVPDTNKQIDKSSVYLVDSGGQYMCVNNSVYRQTQRYARVRFVSSAVILSMCPGRGHTSRRQWVTPIGVKFCMMVHIGPGCVFSSFGGDTPEISKIQNFGRLKSEYFENGKSQVTLIYTVTLIYM